MTRLEDGIGHFIRGYGFLQQYRPGFRLVEEAEFPHFVMGDKYEFVVCGRPAEEAVPVLDGVSPAHALCLFPGEDAELVQPYKDRGYRQRFTEFLMQYRLEELEPSESAVDIKQAVTADDLQRMSKAKGWGRRYEPKYLDNDEVYTLYAEEGGEVIGGGNLVLLEADGASYVEDVFTVESRQGKGVGRALMQALLGVARDHGARCNTLVAFASAGAFYERLGYGMLAELKYLAKKK